MVFSTVLYLIINYFFSSDFVFVDTPYGQVQGFKAISREGRTFSQFNSIPYAKPPLGELRFQPPEKLEPWEGIKDVTKFANYCMQFESALLKLLLGREDCLYLAIYTPQIPGKLEKEKAKLLPVMVYIHGGYFMFGGMDFFNGMYFMDEDIVVVTIQYRVGALGFLNTGDDVVTGNMGLKDQNAALKWVQSSIEHFGGDPNRVTLFGSSAGGASVHHHMMSEMSKGLFHRAISHSASSFCPWAYARNPKEQSVHLGNLLNCSTENSTQLVACLKELPAEKIVETHKPHNNIIFDPIEYYAPSIETETENNKDTIFQSQSPYKMAVEGKYSNKVPLIIGFNSGEGCLKSAALVNDEEKLNRLSTDWNLQGKNTFILFDKNAPDVLDKLWNFYFSGSDPNKKNLTKLDYNSLTDLYSDRYFTKCTRDAAILHSRTNAPTYLYYFTYKNRMSAGGSLAASKGRNGPALWEVAKNGIKELAYNWLGWEQMDYGVCHGDEIQNIFSFTAVLPFSKNSPDYEFSKKMVKLWANFARDGKPGGIGETAWLPISPNDKKLKYLNLDKNIKMIDDPLESRMKFWKSLKILRNLEPELEDKFEEL